jgi:hypothetical protein
MIDNVTNGVRVSIVVLTKPVPKRILAINAIYTIDTIDTVNSIDSVNTVSPVRPVSTRGTEQVPGVSPRVSTGTLGPVHDVRIKVDVELTRAANCSRNPVTRKDGQAINTRGSWGAGSFVTCAFKIGHWNLILLR